MKLNPKSDIGIFVILLSCLVLINTPFLKMIVAVALVLAHASITSGGFKNIGFSNDIPWIKTIVLALLSAISILSICYFLISPLVDWVTGVSQDLSVYRSIKGNSSSLFTYILVGWLIGGIAEEIVFRGFILTKMSTYVPGKLGLWIAIAVSSSIFGYFHGYQGLSGQLSTGIVGVLLASVYVFSNKNIWLAIFTHGLINTVSMLSIYFDWFSA